MFKGENFENQKKTKQLSTTIIIYNTKKLIVQLKGMNEFNFYFLHYIFTIFKIHSTNEKKTSPIELFII